jgi:hypothetical protein
MKLEKKLKKRKIIYLLKLLMKSTSEQIVLIVSFVNKNRYVKKRFLNIVHV